MMNYRSLFFNIIVILASFNVAAQEKLAAPGGMVITSPTR